MQGYKVPFDISINRRLLGKWWFIAIIANIIINKND